jgi:ATP-binding cassette subfamily C exporter for protease/lipase
VLDEPNANLDDAGERALLQALRELRAAGKTVILITHRPGVIAVADLLALMQAGKIVQCGPRDEVIASLRNESTKSSVVPAE